MPKKTNNESKSSRKRIVGKSNVKNPEKTNQDRFSFDEEIVIGLKRIDEPVVEEKKKRKNNNKKLNKYNEKKQKKKKSQIRKKINKQNNNSIQSKHKQTDIQEPDIVIKSKYMDNYDENSNKLVREKNGNYLSKKIQKKKKHKIESGKNKKKKKIILRLIKWTTLCGIIISGIIYAMLSPMFNIDKITVTGNSKISTETIVSLSKLGIEQNIFNFKTSNVIESVKENAYIDKVEVKRKLPDEVKINVTERKTTFMLSFGNAYVYINNQGYILEITKEKENYPIITGYETAENQIVEGNRLITNDLEKLNEVLKIMEAASSGGNNLTSKITKIDIKDKDNYILTLDKEKKKIEFGDTTNLSTKILWINEFLEAEKKNEGTIYLNVDLNNDRPYFREKV